LATPQQQKIVGTLRKAVADTIPNYEVKRRV
jgi:hypothetical protein